MKPFPPSLLAKTASLRTLSHIPHSTFTTSKTTMGPLTLQTAYTLNSTQSMPLLGYGVYQTPATITQSVVTHALSTGYRHIDSAIAYRNEAPCADAMRASGIKRSEIFFTTKVPPKAVGYKAAKEAIEGSFRETGLEYVDLCLLHAPYGGREGREGAWRAMVEAKEAGKIRSLGVSNYGVHHLAELETYINTTTPQHKIDVGQWEIHPWLPRADIVSWCRARNIAIQAYCPIVRGTRAEHPVLKQIAAKHGRTWAQVLIRWSLQMGYVPLPKSVTEKRIEENADVYEFELDGEDMKMLEFEGSYEPCAWDPTVSKD